MSSGIIIDSRAQHSAKAYAPIDTIFSGSEMDSRVEHSAKASLPIDSTLLGISIDVKPTQP
jgi:hypothetical protein